MFRLKSYIDFLTESNLFIAFAAALYTIQAQVEMGMHPAWHPYLFLIFFATLFEYNLARFITVLTGKSSLNAKKYTWVRSHLRLFYGIVIFSVTGFLIAASQAKREVLYVLFPLGLLTLFYSFPLYKTGEKLFRLREIPLLKIFLIAFIWSSSTLLLPFIQKGGELNWNLIVTLLIQRFFFIFSITIPFDIRDMLLDEQHGTKTLPLHLGRSKAMLLANVALVFFIFLSFLLNNSSSLIAKSVSVVVTLYLLNSKGISKSPYYYTLLDGMIILQAILVIRFS